MKQKIISYFFFGAIAFFSGCSDEDSNLQPSGMDVDWFAITDSSDPTDHLQYEIYRDFDISVYYTDTLGSQFRGINGYGDSIFYYEKLSPFYGVTSTRSDIVYTLSGNRNAIHAGVSLFKDEILPELPAILYPRSVLLVDNLTLRADKTAAEGKREGSVFQGLRTTIIGKLWQIPSMSTTDRKLFVAEVLAAIWYTHLTEHYAEEMEAFYSISESLWPVTARTASIYFQLISSGTADTFKPHWYAYGFLLSSPSMPGQVNPNISVPGEYTMWYTPSQEEDATQYLTAVLSESEAMFQAKYGNATGYDVMLEKFRHIKALVDNVKLNR